MRNFGTAYFYDQRIRVGGIAPVAKIINYTNPDVQFFPEGGELVNDIRSKIAVKAVNSSGFGEDIQGVIEDDAGNVVTDFATQHLGMGIFAITPQAGKSYRAKINAPNGTSFIVNLPIANEEGYALKINTTLNDSIQVKVAVNDKTFTSQKGNRFFIVAQSAGKVYYTSQGNLNQSAYTAAVAKSRFPSGIVQFTLFSQSGEPLAERLAYVQSADSLQLAISELGSSYNANSPVKIHLQVKDSHGNPVTGTFAIAVTNERKSPVDENSESTICNNLLLTSDLKGYVEQPNYYFINNDEKRKADLDVLMLTQGYRSFSWKEILNETYPVIGYQPQHGLELNGIIKTKAGKPIPNSKISLVSTRQNILLDTVSNADGNFSFNGLNIAGSDSLVLRARTSTNGSNLNILIKDQQYPDTSGIYVPQNNPVLSPELSDALHKTYTDYQQSEKIEILKNSRTLKEVKVKSYAPKKPKIQFSANLNGPGNADKVIMGDDLGPAITLSQALVGKLWGVKVTKMSVIIDGVILDHYHFDDVNVDDIYSIEVLRSVNARSIYGSSIEKDGALVITLKNGSEQNVYHNVVPKGIITIPFVGYTKTEVFYNPKYAIIPKDQKTEGRTTVYWNPNIITGKDGIYSFDYFNEEKGTYRVVIEGIDDNGYLGRHVYRYTVK